jgi:hypothetical protein
MWRYPVLVGTGIVGFTGWMAFHSPAYHHLFYKEVDLSSYVAQMVTELKQKDAKYFEKRDTDESLPPFNSKPNSEMKLTAPIKFQLDQKVWVLRQSYVRSPILPFMKSYYTRHVYQPTTKSANVDCQENLSLIEAFGVSIDIATETDRGWKILERTRFGSVETAYMKKMNDSGILFITAQGYDKENQFNWKWTYLTKSNSDLKKLNEVEIINTWKQLFSPVLRPK